MRLRTSLLLSTVSFKMAPEYMAKDFLGTKEPSRERTKDCLLLIVRLAHLSKLSFMVHVVFGSFGLDFL